MRQANYLNGILTVNAVLLAGLIWTQIAGHSGLAQNAAAQSTASGGAVNNTGSSMMVNAGEQRQRMLEALKEIKTSIDATRKAVEGGKFKVEVSNIDQLKAAATK
jgi:hypothetical protein